jgi:hypothetical protein
VPERGGREYYLQMRVNNVLVLPAAMVQVYLPLIEIVLKL